MADLDFAEIVTPYDHELSWAKLKSVLTDEQLKEFAEQNRITVSGPSGEYILTYASTLNVNRVIHTSFGYREYRQSCVVAGNHSATVYYNLYRQILAIRNEQKPFKNAGETPVYNLYTYGTSDALYYEESRKMTIQRLKDVHSWNPGAKEYVVKGYVPLHTIHT